MKDKSSCYLFSLLYLLQPLDVGCFSILKRSYERHVEQLSSRGINYIDKSEFLPFYQQARAEALHEKNIRSSFAATGLVPYELDRVFSILQTQYHTPSPQLHPAQLAQVPRVVKKPHNITQLQHQTELTKQYLTRRTQSPPSSTERAVNQLIKGRELAMHNAVLLTDEYKKVLAENQRQKRKRVQKRTFIAKGGVLSDTEAQDLIEKGNNSRTEVAENAQSRVQQRAPRKCSLCSSLVHTARTCPERQATIP